MTAIAFSLLSPARSAFRWWVRELTGLVPARLRSASRRSGCLLLHIEESHFELLYQASRRATFLGKIALNNWSEAVTDAKAIFRKAGLSRAISRGAVEVRVRLNARHALRTRFDLPLAADENLREVIGFELDRHTPFKLDQVYFTHEVVGRDALGQRITVAVTVAPKSLVDKQIEMATKLGLIPDRVDVASEGGGAAPSWDLIGRSEMGKIREAGSQVTWALAVLMIALSGIAVAIPVVRAQQNAQTLAREFAMLKRTSEAIAALHGQIEQLRDEESFLVQRKRSNRSLSQLIFETTRVLPDDTWLNELQVNGPDIQIVGYSMSASRLIGLLEQSRTFRNTTFRSPVTRDAKTDRERFHIAARIEQEGR
jgi:general secretion pathway protein L